MDLYLKQSIQLFAVRERQLRSFHFEVHQWWTAVSLFYSFLAKLIDESEYNNSYITNVHTKYGEINGLLAMFG